MKFKNSDLALGALNDTVFTIAKLAHHGQTDQSGDEYFQHPVRVAAMARKEMPGNPYVFAVGMLHDVLEDTHWTANHLRVLLSAYEEADVEAILKSVFLLTRTSDNVDTYYEAIKTDPVALVVKLCDIRDNMDPTRLAKLSDERQLRLIKKYSKGKEKLSF